MTVDEFVNKVAKPMYVYRMAKPHGEVIASFSGYPTKAMIKSAKTRMKNAEKEIDLLIHEYMGVK